MTLGKSIGNHWEWPFSQGKLVMAAAKIVGADHKKIIGLKV